MMSNVTESGGPVGRRSSVVGSVVGAAGVWRSQYSVLE